ncbi:major facilitator superfamily domain-containing protein 10 [Protobothrops mucrosquamatus]|uniref:major facilitator superfamily domain-containing protein 10 n=1 Tax=Protobothrops mucrosquamatus TaxID=103944 RepID=UPI000775C107|nr:major facilitator superfamily domain-containing protein 10 [Protobothrops mucrosquamatus]
MSREEQGARRAEENSSRVIFVVFLSLLLDLLAFTLILPLLPSILDHFSKNEDGLYKRVQAGVDWFSGSLGIPPERKYNSVLFGGLIGSLFSLLQFLASPLTGAASDSFGRRPALLATALGLIASYALWAVSSSFELFLCSRILGGISKGNVSLCTAIVADLQCPKARSKGMAMIGLAFSLGFTLGPMLGAFLVLETEKDQVFYVRAAIFATIFAVTDFLFISACLPETLPKEKRVSSMTSSFQSAFNLISPWALFRFSAVRQKMGGPSRDNLQILGLVYFLYLFLFSGLEYTLGFLVHQHFQFSSLEQGKMFFCIGVTMAVIQGGYTRQIKPGAELRVVKTAIMLSAPGFLLIGWSPNIIVLGTGLLFYSFAAAVVVPCLSTVVSGYGLDSQKGTVMGILRSLGALARSLGPVVSATVYWLAGAEVCFTVCASLFLLPFVLLRWMPKPNKEE